LSSSLPAAITASFAIRTGIAVILSGHHEGVDAKHYQEKQIRPKSRRPNHEQQK
jgi:hypothetical protein